MQAKLRLVLPLSSLLLLAFFIPHAKADTLVDDHVDLSGGTSSVQLCDQNQVLFQYHPSTSFVSSQLEVRLKNYSSATTTIGIGIAPDTLLPIPRTPDQFVSFQVPPLIVDFFKIPLTYNFNTSLHTGYSLIFQTVGHPCDPVPDNNLQIYVATPSPSTNDAYCNITNDPLARGIFSGSACASAEFRTYKNLSQYLRFFVPTDNSFAPTVQPGSDIQYGGICRSSEHIGFQEYYCPTSGPMGCTFKFFDTNCASGNFIFDGGILPNGRYQVTATSTFDTDTIRYGIALEGNPIPVGTSPTVQCGPPDWSCPVPYLESFDVCGAVAYMWGALSCSSMDSVRTNFSSITNVKPYKYFFQVKDAVIGGLATTTSSTPPVLEIGNMGHGTTTIFDAKKDFPVAEQTLLTQARPYEKTAINVLYVLAIIALFIPI